VRNVVVLALLSRISLVVCFQLQLAIEGVVFSLVRQPVLRQILVDRQLHLVFLVRIKHEFDFAESLEAVKCDLVKLVQ